MNPLNHVAIIMDGNGRWGLKYKNSRNLGHKEGLKVIEKLIKPSIKKKIRYLTLFVFSTENWKRPKNEIKYLFNLLENFLIKKLDYLKSENIKIKFIGNLKFEKKLKKLLLLTEKMTDKNCKIQINIAINYGSRNEILRSVKLILKNRNKINIRNLEKNLYTKEIPNPDILIRTGDTRRLSNFMLWQIAYTEIFFEKKLWPEFQVKDFYRIIKNYKMIKRNFGSI